MLGQFFDVDMRNAVFVSGLRLPSDITITEPMSEEQLLTLKPTKLYFLVGDVNQLVQTKPHLLLLLQGLVPPQWPLASVSVHEIGSNRDQFGSTKLYEILLDWLPPTTDT